ncbi:methyl-accepting chemotaxis protein [Mobilisporobacter senegalensis]|uniref:Methyl-accepting chemotaxis protein n=1 Tax=Mobilisporobacter senegalensis TaxID=1329262 RepID=A0A3N1XT61_9FIRM|nr:methyl-accepting chemotaxis protein [Mobilisporobacter senegalensis]ROR29351.1 methyl-accepting chemotaxis protein [Mobilisporobacter senegalensis]
MGKHKIISKFKIPKIRGKSPHFLSKLRNLNFRKPKKEVLINHPKQKMKFGILQKLIVGFIVPVLFIVALGIISYSKSSDGLISNYEQSTSNTINMSSDYMEYVFNSIDAVSKQYVGDTELSYFTRGLVNNTASERLKYVTTINNELMKKVELEKFIENIHIIADTNIPVLTSELENTNGFYTELKENEEGLQLDNAPDGYTWIGEHLFIDSKLGIDSKDYGFSLIRKFSPDKACIVIDVKRSEIETFLKNLNLGENSIVGLVTPDGKEIIIQNSSSNDTKIIEDFKFSKEEYYIESLNREDLTGSQYVNYNSEEHLYFYNKIGETGITIAALIPKTNIMSQANDIRTITFVIVALACIVAVSIGSFISGGIVKCIKNINHKLKQISEGDLTVEVSVNRKDEFEILVHNITDMLNNMRNLIRKVASVSGLVSDSAIHVMEASNTIFLSSDHISMAIEEIGNGIAGQAEDSQNCLVQMDELSNKITVVNDNLKNIEKSIDDSKNMITQGITRMEELNKQSQETNRITKYVVDNITALEIKSKSIGEIVEFINEIADQTNLLSLNASIEAARAGSAGRGFAVVADEIRNLATQSMKAANDINIVISDIANQTSDTVCTAKEAENIVNAQNNIVENTITTFKNMSQKIEELINNVSEIGKDMKNMETARAGTLGAVENISAISQETYATSNNISEIVHDQSVSVGALEEASGILGKNAKELEEAIHMFQI